jgi:hypothetical protein
MIRLKIISILIASIITCAYTMASSPEQQYRSARKQFILEYTVFGIDECLKRYGDNLTVDKENKKNNEILVGSSQYFSMLSRCFARLKDLCPGKKCIVPKSMGKRMENVRHVDQLLSKYSNKRNGRIIKSKQTNKVIRKQQLKIINHYKNTRDISSKIKKRNGYIIRNDYTRPSFIIEEDMTEGEVELIDYKNKQSSSSRNIKRDKQIRQISSLNIFKVEDEDFKEAPRNLFK